MKLVLHPAVEPERLAKIVEAARPTMAVVNAASPGDSMHSYDYEYQTTSTA